MRIFTFGYGQTDPKTGLSLANRYVRVHGDDIEVMKEVMVDRFGDRYPDRAVGNWAFDYPSEEAAGVHRWDMIEIDFDTGHDLAAERG